MVIPEGDWYCPECQHKRLIEGLETKLKAFETLYKSKEAEIKRRERLAFVSMSLSNIIPSSRDDKKTKAAERKFHKAEKKPSPKRKPRKRSDDDYSGSSSGKIICTGQLGLYSYSLSLTYGY